MATGTQPAARSVSPSIIAAERRDRAQVKPRRRSFKRAAEDAMSSLDDMASAGDVSENGYIKLAKHLKTVHESHEKRTTLIAEGVVIEMAAQAPHALIWAPRAVDYMDHNFLRKLLLARYDKHCTCGHCRVGCGGDDEWLQELVEVFLGPEDSGMDMECIRNNMFMMLDVDAKRLGPAVVFHLTTVLKDLSPDEIFDDDSALDHEHAIELYPNRDLFDWLVRDLDGSVEDDALRRDDLECFLEECLDEEQGEQEDQEEQQEHK